MDVANRVLFNMVVLYLKMLITIVVSLCSVPLVMRALGVSDYGLYSLIAGVIVMLSFLNSSMTVSTQRYMSVSMGKGDDKSVKQIFNVSIVLHLVIGFAILFLLEIGSVFLFNGFLNIDSSRIEAAKFIYQFLVISTLFSILSVPFDAIINAHENMLAFSILEIIESVSKLIIAFFLVDIHSDKLMFYGASLAIIAVAVMLLKWLFCIKKYPICKLELRELFDFNLFKEMFSFAGWNTFGAVAMLGRNQGMAIILNVFFGTVLNASYGVANQINGVLSNFSSIMQKSINPQLMISEGGNNRERMLNMTFISSKFSFFLLSIFAIPLIIEMPYVLKIWLKEVPQYTVWFSRLMLILSLLCQYSVGIMSAIQSAGKIKTYQITMGSLLILNLPVSYLFLSNGFPSYSVLICGIIIEIISLVTRMFFAKTLLGFRIDNFIKEVIAPSFLVFLLVLFLSIIPLNFITESFLRLILTCFCSTLMALVGIWFFGLNENEMSKFKNIFHTFLNKIK